MDDSKIEINEPFKFDSVQYSDSKTKYILSGTIRYFKEDYSFSLLGTNSPKSKIFKMEYYTFPLKSLDSSQFDCIYTY